MTDTLRAKQNMEILDVFKNINSQVVGLQNKQVQGFQESIKPKTQRDLGAEVNVDKAIENINKTIETKLGALEYVVQNINPSNRGRDAAEELTKDRNANIFYANLSQVNNSGDIIPLYNSIVRAYMTVGVNRETQQIIKVKVQELTPNLDAMVYGLNQAIDIIFGRKIISVSFAGTILDLLRTLSVYSELKSQVESNPPRFELFNVDLLDRSFKNIFESQSADRLQILKDYAPRGLASSSTIRNIPDIRLRDIKSRITALEEELGVRLDDARRNMLYNRLSGLSGVDLTNALNEIKSQFSQPRMKKFNEEEKDAIKNAQRVSNNIVDVMAAMEENSQMRRLIEMEIEDLETKEPLSQEEVKERLFDVPQEPIEPPHPNIADYYDIMGGFDLDDYNKAVKLYDDWLEAYLARFRIIVYNEVLEDLAIETEAERQERIDNLREEYVKLLEEAERLRYQLDRSDEESQIIKEYINERKLNVIRPGVDALFEVLKDKPLFDANKLEARAKASIRGYGRSRVQKNNIMDFDDEKNDNYS